MGKTVYFDTNVLGDLYQRRSNVTAHDELAVRSAVRDGKISIVLSILNFEEKLCAFNDHPDLTLAELQFMQDLVDWDKCVMEPGQLLRDDIRSYIQSGEQSSPFMTDSRRIAQVREVLNSGMENIARFSGPGFLELVGDRKTNFRHVMTRGKEAVQDHLENLGIQKPKVSFGNYWKRSAKLFVEKVLITSPEMLAACQARGLDGLLDIRSVRLCAGAYLSLIHAYDIDGRQPEGRNAEGDTWDMGHAISASAADIFVTHDNSFACRMNRISINNFEVADLHDLLKQIS
jgi:hypothetical protein